MPYKDKEKQKEYYQRPEVKKKRREDMRKYRKENLEKVRKLDKQNYEKHKKERLEQQKKYRQEHKDDPEHKLKIKARNMANYHLKHLKKPGFVFHHPDYSKPLLVEVLPIETHHQLHTQLNSQIQII